MHIITRILVAFALSLICFAGVASAQEGMTIAQPQFYCGEGSLDKADMDTIGGWAAPCGVYSSALVKVEAEIFDQQNGRWNKYPLFYEFAQNYRPDVGLTSFTLTSPKEWFRNRLTKVNLYVYNFYHQDGHQWHVDGDEWIMLPGSGKIIIDRDTSDPRPVISARIVSKRGDLLDGQKHGTYAYLARLTEDGSASYDGARSDVSGSGYIVDGQVWWRDRWSTSDLAFLPGKYRVVVHADGMVSNFETTFDYHGGHLDLGDIVMTPKLEMTHKQTVETSTWIREVIVEVENWEADRKVYAVVQGQGVSSEDIVVPLLGQDQVAKLGKHNYHFKVEVPPNFPMGFTFYVKVIVSGQGGWAPTGTLWVAVTMK